MTEIQVNKLHPPILGKRNVVFLGCGSFNPVTIMHLRLFHICRDILKFDLGCNVLGGYISPVSDGYKKDGLISGEHRLKCVQLACESDSFITPLDFEVTKPDWTETIHVMNYLKGQLFLHFTSEIEIFLICGADLFLSFTKPGVWTDEDIEALCANGICVVRREGIDLEAVINSHPILSKYSNCTPQKIIIQTLDNEFVIPIEISSTKVRAYVKNGRDVKYLVPDAVKEYIASNSLYL